jgi:acid stress chaperone HdeB
MRFHFINAAAGKTSSARRQRRALGMGPTGDIKRIDLDQWIAGWALAGCAANAAGGIMPRSLIVFAAMLSLAAPAAAEEKMVVDMSKMTCAELTKLGFQDFAGITMWMSGYYNASVRSTVIDLYEFARAAKTVKDYCATSPRATVMSAAERALAIKMPRGR